MIKFLRKPYRCFKKIKVPEEFIKTPPNPYKLIEKTVDFFDKQWIGTIYVDKEYNLLYIQDLVKMFSITPAGWKVGDLVDGVVPKLSIKWYAEAMRKPMIMTKPSIFGYNPGTGQFLGGGEAGSEVVSGTSTLMEMMNSVVASQNSGLEYYLQKIIEILADAIPQLIQALDIDINIDVGDVVGKIAPAMNTELGKLLARRERGR